MRGKFLAVGDEKLYVRGVTYGTFRPDQDGGDYRDPEVVERDFARMVATGVNAIRTYTVPPRWLLDLAQRHGLRVMVGLPWEQHVTFLDDRARAREIEERVRAGVRACAGHRAVLCYAIGNEIPAPIARWHGARKIERFVERLYRAAKAEDPDALVTYVNYPSTEYLDLSFLDFICFNVYLESKERLQAYLARLQNIAGERPLVMGEIGLDSRRNGEERQAYALYSQVRTVFEAGCAGAFVFAWTDEWHRGGYDVDDWDFGLVDRARQPKPALAAVQGAFADVPFARGQAWPKVSVVVCSYNGGRTIRDCCEGLVGLEYPDFEVIVVDDGSTDDTAAIAREYGFGVISTENRGLSSARNTGLALARGEIVAYTDDDARPDPHWLQYLAFAFMNGDYAGVGGPNIAPPGDGTIADCVANAPGGPVHVLLSDREAEHIPGCNMAYRRECLEAIGGFDPRYRAAGDDVDVCWRLQERGWTLGFSPAAMVWHHRRDSVRAYWKQQVGYGKAEALLERKWPQKYNAGGHHTWSGRLYGGLRQALGWRRGRIHHGPAGTAPFQSVYQPADGLFWSLPLMPEWYLLIAALAGLAALGVLWRPLLMSLPLLALALGASLLQASAGAAQASFSENPGVRSAVLRLLTAGLHLMQPLARLFGRMRHGLTPWRWRGVRALALPRPRTATIWSERWQSPEAWLRTLVLAVHAQGARSKHGGDGDRWDFEVHGGIFGAARARLVVEEHGAGRQLMRIRVWPRRKIEGLLVVLFVAPLALVAALDQSPIPGALLGGLGLLLLLRTLQECAAATAGALHAVEAAKSVHAEAGNQRAESRNGHEPPRRGLAAAAVASTPT